MSLSLFKVTLVGRDDTGKFLADYRVVASVEAEAEVMARASASLQEMPVYDVGAVSNLGPPPEENDDVRRVLGRGPRQYATS
jgi:hypothetical protein